MDLVFFVLLVGALVLVHELGHFAAARAFGVKVLTFSLGFGPPIVKLRGRETTYQLGLLPFGGFVKLLQEPTPRRAEPSVEIAPEDRHRTYEAQPIVRRALIALAGPTMNLVVPIFLFFAVFLEPTKQLPPTIGLVIDGSPAAGLLFPGDRVLTIDGTTIDTYAEVQARIAASPGKKLAMRVARVDPITRVETTVDVVVVPRAATETRELGVTRVVGRLGVGASPLSAAIGVPSPSSPAARAGLRTFDVITHVGGVPTPRFLDLERRLRENLGTSVPVNYLRPSALPVPEGSPLVELAIFEARVAVLAPEIPSGASSPGDDLLARTGIEATDLYAASVTEGSSEWRAGLRPGDRLRTLDSVPVKSWQALVEDLVAGADRTREVGYSREGKLMTGVLRVSKEEWVDAAGQHVERYVFRTTHWTPTIPPPLVDEPAPVRTAMRRALGETAHVVRFLATGAMRLVQGKLTVRAISGPITIYDVAGRAGARGARDFLWVMALISINLGLLNLLPIPTLDGGQLLFLTVEGVTRRPVPIRVREMLSFVGFLLLVAIMVIALVNDLRR
ncbi:MAG: site-2 protease family protein [Polyangiales bacterium]